VEARAKLLGHPIHPILVVFPLGLLSTSVGFDVAYWMTDTERWAEIAYWLIVIGLIGGVAAALFGLLDWLAIPPRTRAWRIGLLHGLGNIVVLSLFGVSWLLRAAAPAVPSALAIALSLAGVVLATLTGWLGGELVNRLGIGVHEGANVNAPSSLKQAHQP